MVSAPRVSFSGRHLELADVEQLHSDTVASMRQYFSVSNPEYASRFNGYSTSELAEELHESIEEHEGSCSIAEMSDRVAKIADLSEEDISATHKGNMTLLEYRLAWTRIYFSAAVHRVGHGLDGQRLQGGNGGQSRLRLVDDDRSIHARCAAGSTTRWCTAFGSH